MNLDSKTTEYLEKMATIKLSDSSRFRLQSNLLDYARFHSVISTVRVDAHGRSIEQVPVRTSFISQILKLHPKSMIAALLVVMLLVGGGTTFAAQSAVPGDVLYPIKVDVNEKVQSALAFSNSAEAALQVRLAEERLEEAETLAARGELTAAVAADVDTRLKAHYHEAETLSAAIETNGDYSSSATVRATLEGMLRSHAITLSDLNSRIAGNSGMILITNIGVYAGMMAQAETEATATIKTSVEVKSASEATIAAAEATLLKVQTAVTQAESAVSADVTVAAKVKLAKAVALEAEAKASFTTGAYSEAYAASQNAIRIGSEVSSMLKTNLNIQDSSSTFGNTPLDTRTTTSGEVKAGATTNTVSKTGTTATTTSDETTPADTTQTVDVKGEVHTEGTANTGIIDTKVKTDTSIQSGVGI